jgi:hypothetical protein
MALIPTGVLTDLQNVTNSFMADTLTVTRTGASLSCRVASMGTGSRPRELRMEGADQFAIVPIWLITVPLGSDLKGADVATVTKYGTYLVTGDFQSRTYAVDSTHEAILCNQTVSFRRQSSTGTVTATSVPVAIFRVSKEAHLDTYAARFKRVPFWSGNQLMSDGSAISANDEIVWGELGKDGAGNARSTELRYVSRTYFPTQVGTYIARGYFENED